MQLAKNKWVFIFRQIKKGIVVIGKKHKTGTPFENGKLNVVTANKH